MSDILPKRNVFHRTPFDKEGRLFEKLPDLFNFEYGVEIMDVQESNASFASGEGCVIPSNHVDFVLIISVEKEFGSARNALRDSNFSKLVSQQTIDRRFD